MKLNAFLIACSAAIIPCLAAHAQPTDWRSACASDVQSLCAGVQPGGGRIVACLKQHMDQVSDGCKRAAGVPVPSASNPAPAPSPATPSVNHQGGGDASAYSPNDPSPNRSPAHNSGSDTHPAAFAVASLPVGPSKAKVKFVQRDILDHDHDNMRAMTFYIPETWSFDSQMTWHYDAPWYPVRISANAENPANAEAYFAYAGTRMTYAIIPPQLRQYAKGIQPGMAPLPPVQAMSMFIKQTRPNVANLKWVGQQDLPNMAKALKVPDASNLRGVAVKIRYDYRGQSVDEAFFGLYYRTEGSNGGVNAGMIKQTVWGLEYLQSFRTPAGQLERNMATFSVIAKSIYVNPEWIKLETQVTDQITAAVEAKIKQGYAQIAASKAAAEQTMAQEAAFNKSFEAQEARLRSPGVDDSWLRTSSGGSGGSGSRSAADNFSNLIREEDTVNDPSTGGTKQLTNAGSNHFTNGLGDYRTYDDPNMTPEQAGESGSWDRMTIAP